MRNQDVSSPGWRRSGRTAVAVVVMWALIGSVGAVAASASSNSAGKTTSSSLAAGVPLVTTAAVPVHGVGPAGQDFTGTYRIKRFKVVGNQVYAVGRLAGSIGGVTGVRGLSLPVNGASNPAPVAGAAAPRVEPTPGACDILTLALGPLDLDILGLRIALDPVNALIEAIPGAGNLLGNLLCAVAGLLDGPTGTTGLGTLLTNLLTSVTNLLNGLLGL